MQGLYKHWALRSSYEQTDSMRAKESGPLTGPMLRRFFRFQGPQALEASTVLFNISVTQRATAL